MFGGPFSSALAPQMSEASLALQNQIQAEMGKSRKDYSQLKQLKSKLQTQAAVDEKAVVLQTELKAAEQREDFDRCEELQSQLEGLAMSVSGSATPGAAGGAAGAQGQITPYDGPYAPGYTGERGMSRRQDIVLRTRGAYGYGGMMGPYVGGYGMGGYGYGMMGGYG